MNSQLLALCLGIGQKKIDEELGNCDEAERVEILTEVFDQLMGTDPEDIAQARKNLVESGLAYGMIAPEDAPDFTGIN